MQDSNFIDRTDMISPSFSKNVTICFNEEKDSPLQLIAWDEDKGTDFLPLIWSFLNNHPLGSFMPTLQQPTNNIKLGFVVNPEAEKFFESLKDDKLGVIAMVGKNRTGKSSLLNRVILNRTKGFNVGHTINPCTKVSLISQNKFWDLLGNMDLASYPWNWRQEEWRRKA